MGRGNERGDVGTPRYRHTRRRARRVSEIRKVSAAVARRFLVLRHLLAPPRSLPPERESVLRVVDRLGSLQFDPLEVAGRNHDLVLLARIQGYRRDWPDYWLSEDRPLYSTQIGGRPCGER